MAAVHYLRFAVPEAARAALGTARGRARWWSSTRTTGRRRRSPAPFARPWRPSSALKTVRTAAARSGRGARYNRVRCGPRA